MYVRSSCSTIPLCREDESLVEVQEPRERIHYMFDSQCGPSLSLWVFVLKKQTEDRTVRGGGIMLGKIYYKEQRKALTRYKEGKNSQGTV